MGKKSLDEVEIRTELRPGDVGRVLHSHGALYAKENGYGKEFEAYVARGLGEFLERYNPELDRVWLCEREGKMVGFLLAMHRDDAAQLRYFLIEPEYRGIGLGSKLMGLCLAFIKEKGYKRAFLWTTDEQTTATRLYVAAGFSLAEEKESRAFGKPLRERRYDLMLT